MKKVLAKTIAGVALFGGISAGAMAEGGIFDAENFSGNVTYTSNYVFRGETQSDNQGAIQGGFDWEYGNWYAGTWASSTDYSSFDANESGEIDLYLGYWNSIGAIDYDIMILDVRYPGADDDGFEMDYTEYYLTLSHTFDGDSEATPYVMFAHTPDAFGEEGSGDTVEVGASFTLSDNWGIDFVYGNSQIDGDNSGWEIEWDYWNIGLTTSWNGFDIDLRYWNAEEDDEFTDNDSWWLLNDSEDEDHAVISISRSL